MEELLLIGVPVVVGVFAAAGGVLLGRRSGTRVVLGTEDNPSGKHEHEWTRATRRGWHCSHCRTVSKNPKGLK